MIENVYENTRMHKILPHYKENENLKVGNRMVLLILLLLLLLIIIIIIIIIIIVTLNKKENLPIC